MASGGFYRLKESMMPENDNRFSASSFHAPELSCTDEARGARAYAGDQALARRSTERND
jgi:hypothetical protein